MSISQWQFCLLRYCQPLCPIINNKLSGLTVGHQPPSTPTNHHLQTSTIMNLHRGLRTNMCHHLPWTTIHIHSPESSRIVLACPSWTSLPGDASSFADGAWAQKAIWPPILAGFYQTVRLDWDIANSCAKPQRVFRLVICLEESNCVSVYPSNQWGPVSLRDTSKCQQKLPEVAIVESADTASKGSMNQIMLIT